MSTARDEILARVQGALDKSAPAARRDEAQLLAAVPLRRASVRPGLGGDAVGVFMAKAAANLINIVELASLADVPGAVSRILASENLAPDISVAPALQQLNWPATMTIRSAKARLDEKLTVSLASAAIAETGSLVLCSGDNAPSSLTYAGERHVIVLHRKQITSYLEDGLAAVKAAPPRWPRTVNLVSGPSRTADVAGIVVRPAHGPKAVDLLLVD